MVQFAYLRILCLMIGKFVNILLQCCSLDVVEKALGSVWM
jgi:hypothetical protein